MPIPNLEREMIKEQIKRIYWWWWARKDGQKRNAPAEARAFAHRCRLLNEEPRASNGRRPLSVQSAHWSVDAGGHWSVDTEPRWRGLNELMICLVWWSASYTHTLLAIADVLNLCRCGKHWEIHCHSWRCCDAKLVWMQNWLIAIVVSEVYVIGIEIMWKIDTKY